MKKKCTKKKLTAEQKAAQLKKRKVLAFRKKIRSSFTDAGFTYFSTLDKHFPIGTRTVELDYLFLYENIIVICEDNTKQKKDIDHIRNKNESFAEIRNNKTAFLNWLSNTFPEKATMVKQYRPERYFLYYIYISQAIFDNHFINIDAIPAGWRKGNLLDIANYLNGLAMQKFRPQGNEIGLPVLKIKELRQGSCDDSSELCSLRIKPEYIIHDGDVIFSWSGSLLVDIWCGGTCGLNQHLFKVTSDIYDKWFYYLWTAHHLARFIAIAADKATTMGHIKREELAKAEVLIPCEEDYTSLTSIMQPIFELIISNRIEGRKLAVLRDELLPKLMSGEIDVSAVQL